MSFSVWFLDLTLSYVSRPGHIYEVVSDIDKKQPYLNINVTIYNLDSGLIQLP